MTKRKIKPGTIGPDVDLETEDIRLADGRRLTDGLVEEIAERASGMGYRIAPIGQ